MNIPIDIRSVRLETERLILRQWTMADLQDLFEYSSDPAVGDLGGWPALRDISEARELLDSFLKEPYVFALELKNAHKVIGSLCVDWLEPVPELENTCPMILGYDLHREYWGLGLMPEAVRAVIPYCFDTLQAKYLRIGAFARNTRSQRVAEKCGFFLWKEMPYLLKSGEQETEMVYLLKNPNL